MMKRARIKVVGTAVQHVGYRDDVEKIASQLLIVGSIINLEDGSVEIICEGVEDIINEFIEKINIRENEGKPFFPRIWVENVSVLWGEPKGEFNSFGRSYTKSEDFLKDIAFEMKVGRDVLINLSNHISNFTTFTNTSFKTIESKYHVISILAYALLLSVSTISIIGTLIYSNIIPRNSFTFIFILIPNVFIWAGVIYFAFKPSTT